MVRNVSLTLTAILALLAFVSGITEAAEAAASNDIWNIHFAHCVQQTNDGGYIVAGDTGIVKLNISGDMEWQKSPGKTETDNEYAKAKSALQTSDGGYIVAGWIEKVNIAGDVITSHYDALVVKLNSSGEIVWQKRLGGTGDELFNSIQQTSDGGYIAAGRTSSTDGDVTDNHGDQDAWVVKLDVSGDIVWQKCLGGSRIDELNSIQQTIDGGYIAAGWTSSTDGDVTGNHGKSDAWIVKLDASGKIVWQKCLGGSEYDNFNSIQQISDGGYIAAGSTSSTDGDVMGNYGLGDIWILKLSTTGDITWQKRFGGSYREEATSIQQTSDGGYIVAGDTDSIDGDVKGNHGLSDMWIIKLNASGDMVWQKCIGGAELDFANSIQQTSDGGYIIAGWTNSLDGDMIGHDSSVVGCIVKLNASGDIEW